MINKEAIEAGLAAYEAYINGANVIDRRVLVRKVFEAMEAAVASSNGDALSKSEAASVEWRLAALMENGEVRVDGYRLSPSDTAKVVAALRAIPLASSKETT